ncbi:hypothetical protein [Rhizobium sp. AAP43]|uniref:hypothetical protein n=1 Tax=Rhizobium sp. AAP43 TaxID=1523420 RepID=UPI0006B97FE7|nr:hypothetical protein [Rhizobium sp. AAP43]KPF46493.1 hypothetical protein IP76_06395 [Rhizobium sp. AAP43]
MVDLFKRMFRKDPSSEASTVKAPVAAPERQELQLAARRAQIANDLMELQQIAMAELALRKQQEAAAAGNGMLAQADTIGHSDFDGDTPYGQRVAIL